MEQNNYFNNLISLEEHFIDMPDCIADGSSYKETIENSIKITDGILKIDSFNWKNIDNKYEFDIVINNYPVNFSVKVMSDYVDSEGLINGLNKVLEETKYEGKKRFCDINGGVADFGIAFITLEKEVELASNGLIWRSEEFLYASKESIQSNQQINTKIETEQTDSVSKKLDKTTKPWWKFW